MLFVTQYHEQENDMIQTTPQKLRAEIEDAENHDIERDAVAREDRSYHDAFGLVEHFTHDFLNPHKVRELCITLDVKTEKDDLKDYSWSAPPSEVVWEWWDQQRDEDVEFEDVKIITEATLKHFHVNVISRSQTLITITYHYVNEVYEVF